MLDIMEIRSRIEKVKVIDYEMCLKYIYLIDGRASEAISRKCPGDKTLTEARGPRGRDYSIHEYDGIEAVVFQVKTAKRGGMIRACAIPLVKEYDPWGIEVVDYFSKFASDEPVFYFTRQKMWEISKGVFDGLSYPIEEYDRIIEGQKVKVNRHEKNFRTHGLRHARATDLVLFYGFDGMDLSQFGGWTLRTMLGVGTSISRYAHLDWRRYFPKLLKKRY